MSKFNGKKAINKNSLTGKICTFLRRHLLAIVVVLFFAVGAAATAIIVSRDIEEVENPGGTITILKPATESRIAMYNPVSFDPLASSDEDVVYLNQLIFGYLFRLDQDLNIVPDLVETYIPDREKASVEIFLKENLWFSDGKTLDADDVEFTIDTIAFLGSQSPYYNYVKKILNVTVTDKKSLIIEFSDPRDAALDNLVFPIVSKETYDTGNFKLGSGPYVYGEYRQGKSLVLNPNPLYYGKVPEVQVNIGMVKDKEILPGLTAMDDVTAYISQSTSADNIALDKGLRCRYLPSGELEYLGFNCSDTQLSNNRMRQAISYAIDRNEIIENDYGGGALLSDSLYFPGFLGVEEEDVLIYDPKKASEILADLGYSDINEDKILETPEGEPFVFRLIVSDDSGVRKDAADTIVKNLNSVGISVEVLHLDQSELNAALRTGNFDMYLAGIKLDKQFKMTELFSSANYGKFNDETTINLVEQLELCLSAEEEKAVFVALKPLLNNQLPYFPIGYKAYYFISVPSLSVTENPMYFDPYRNIGEWNWQKKVTTEE